MKTSVGLLSVVYLDSFILFPEYFIGICCIYLLIVVVLITYNVYGLMLQKVISEFIAIILIMACYLLINDDLLRFNFLSFNDSIVTDYFAFFSKLIICSSSALYFLIISSFLKHQRLTSFEYLLITLFAVLGLILLCSSNDLLTAYLAIELSSLASYLLASFKKTSNYSIESGLKYFVTGALSSSFFLLGSSFVYGQVASINFNSIRLTCDTRFSDRLPFSWIDWRGMAQTDPDWILKLVEYVWRSVFEDWSYYSSSLVDLGLALIMFSLFIKLGLAPFHLWTLDVYEGSPTPATFFFAVISKLSIFVLLVRFFTRTFFTFAESWLFYSIIIAVVSIFVGSIGGLQTRKLKTLLAYSSISHMGYALLSFSTLHQILGFEMLFFYLVIYIIAGLATWFIIMSLNLKTKNLTNKYSKELGDLVSLHKSNAALALAFALTMFSLAGIPPMIGFLSKLGVFLSVINSGFEIFNDIFQIFNRGPKEIFHVEFYFIALITILCSVISTFYYIRIVKILYFENTLVGKLYYPINNQKILILSLLIFLLIFLFINPTFLYLIIHLTFKKHFKKVLFAMMK